MKYAPANVQLFVPASFYITGDMAGEGGELLHPSGLTDLSGRLQVNSFCRWVKRIALISYIEGNISNNYIPRILTLTSTFFNQHPNSIPEDSTLKYADNFHTFLPLAPIPSHLIAPISAPASPKRIISSVFIWRRVG